MKKNSLMLVVISTLLFPIDKFETKLKSESQKPSAGQASTTKWNRILKQYREAAVILSEAPATSSNIGGGTIVNTFGPYGNISGTSFGMFAPAGSKITGIGVGGEEGIVTNLFLAYRNSAGTLSTSGVGKTVNDPDKIKFIELDSDEYIIGISGKKDTYLTQLTIKTNKNRMVTAGNGATGTAFSETCQAGYWVFGCWGYASNSRVFQVNFNVHCKPWELQSGSDGKDIAVAPDGTIYMVNTVGKIYKMTATGTTWTQIQGTDGKWIATNGNRVCMVNKVGKIYELFGATWKQLPGSDAIDIGVASDNKLWIVNSDGEVYRYNDNMKSWEKMPSHGNFKGYRISAGKDVWLLDELEHTIGENLTSASKWDGAKWKGDLFTDGRDISVADDGNVWLTNSSGILYHFNYTKNKWEELCGSSGYTISSNKNKVMMINSSGSIYKLSY